MLIVTGARSGVKLFSFFVVVMVVDVESLNSAYEGTIVWLERFFCEPAPVIVFVVFEA